MQKNSKIFVAGASGMVGGAIIRALQGQGYTNIIGSYFSRKPDRLLITDHSSLTLYKVDLTDQSAVQSFFSTYQPEYVFLAAAKVGGIMANNLFRADFIRDNLLIQANIIHQSYVSGVKKLLFLGSSCIYPRDSPQPMKEDYLLTGPLEYTNEPYAVAKIAGLKMCESYNLQYKTNYISVMPTNLYGPGDNFDLERAHVLPAILRRMHLAKCLEQGEWQDIRNDLNKRPVNGIDGSASDDTILSILASHGISFRDTSLSSYPPKTDNRLLTTVSIWGTGKPMREFLWSEDMADACVYILEGIDFNELVKDMSEIRNTHINLGTGEEYSIIDLAKMLQKLVDFRGELVFDASRPGGTPRKLSNVSRLHNLGWKHKTSLQAGLRKFYRWYLNSCD
jgi:GDP-L-fucose synthase